LAVVAAAALLVEPQWVEVEASVVRQSAEAAASVVRQSAEVAASPRSPDGRRR
jgi:hypothetical protein